MSPMFNACMNAGGGPPGHLGPPSQPNGPPNLNEPSQNPNFYNNLHNSGGAPPPHFNQAPHPAINNFNNNQIPRNIIQRPPNYCPPVYEFKIYEFTKRLNERPDVCCCFFEI